MEKKTWTREEIEAKIMGSDQWLYRSILAIFNKQTEDEKSSETTKDSNGVGFTGCDAGYFSYLAKWLKRNGELTGNHLARARKGIMKYGAQLAKIANGEI